MSQITVSIFYKRIITEDAVTASMYPYIFINILERFQNILVPLAYITIYFMFDFDLIHYDVFEQETCI